LRLPPGRREDRSKSGLVLDLLLCPLVGKDLSLRGRAGLRRLSLGTCNRGRALLVSEHEARRVVVREQIRNASHLSPDTGAYSA
jgi:hypothetical protein